jgi:hypothetical protein
MSRKLQLTLNAAPPSAVGIRSAATNELDSRELLSAGTNGRQNGIHEVTGSIPVWFNGTAADAAATVLVVTAPAGATPGEIDVTAPGASSRRCRASEGGPTGAVPNSRHFRCV